MSVLGDLDSLVLRDTSHPPLTNKEAELTYAEWDAHTTKFYDAIQSIVSGTNVTAYDAGTTYNKDASSYANRACSYNSRIWKAVYTSGDFSNQTPEEGVYWTQATLAELLPDVLKIADNAEHGSIIREVSLTIASADVLTLNSTPIEIVAAPGAGKAIEVVNASLTTDFNSAAYTTNTTLFLRAAGATGVQADNSINASVTRTGRFRLQDTSSSGATDTQIIENAALEVYVASGNPAAGDSDITINLAYREIDV